MSSEILSEISPYLVNFIVPCLENFSFFRDTRVIMAVSGLLPVLLMRLNSKISFNLRNMNVIIVKYSDPYGPRIMKYISNHHKISIKNILLSTNNKEKETIGKLKKDIEVKYNNQKIYINIEERDIKQHNNRNNNFDDESNQKDFSIFFKSKGSIDMIKEFIEKITNENYVVQNNKNVINAFYTKISICEKTRDVDWINVNIPTNKELKYVFVSKHVEEQFCNRIKKFIDDELYYKERGLPYKKSFLLYGPPGCGKTSLLKAISIEYNLPVFIFNLSSLDNAELVSLLFEINNHLKKSERYIVLLEDFDRIIKSIQQNSRNRYCDDNNDNNKKLTIDCVLNFLDGIDESYGRITIITANDISSIVENEALCRPGRIDHMIKLDFCDEEQIKKIANIYDFNLEQNEIETIFENKLTPAKLINFLSVSADNQILIENIKNKNSNKGNENCDVNKDCISINDVMTKASKNGFLRRNSRNKKRKFTDMHIDGLDRKKRKIETSLKRAMNEIKKYDGKKVETEADSKILEIEKQIATLKKEKIICEKEKILKIIDIKEN
jgi:hypothetical protein